MNTQFRKFGLVMSACVETIVFMLAAKWGSDWLDSNYPQSFDWFPILSLLALILIVHSWYVIFRTLIREDQKSSQDTKDNHGR
ncbi:MAG: hypothetical protein ACOH5I_05845 [Oligoflexus sp.]